MTKQALYIESVSLKKEEVPAFDVYPFNLPCIRTLSTLPFQSRITFLVGENGSGKSTLIEAVAMALGINPEGGSSNFSFQTRPSHSPLHQYLTLRRGSKRARDNYFLRAETFYNVATELERLDAGVGFGRPLIDSYGGRSLHAQSHGESFLALFLKRFGNEGLYILDEPEAALSPTRQLAFLARLVDLATQGSQFIIATHSPVLLGCPGSQILVLEEDGFTRTAWENTEHVLVTRRFLNDRDGMLRTLLE